MTLPKYHLKINYVASRKHKTRETDLSGRFQPILRRLCMNYHLKRGEQVLAIECVKSEAKG